MIEQYPRPRAFEEESDDTAACPTCGKNDVTSKVSSIARANRGRLVLEDGSWAAYESELGSLLARPQMPEVLPLGSIVVALVVGWLLLALDLVVVAVLREQTVVSIPEAALETATYLGIAWFGLLIPGVAIVRYLVRREYAGRAMPAWRDASRRWQTFRYCARDDIVFVPGATSGVSPEHITLLYRREASEPIVALAHREVQA